MSSKETTTSNALAVPLRIPTLLVSVTYNDLSKTDKLAFPGIAVSFNILYEVPPKLAALWKFNVTFAVFAVTFPINILLIFNTCPVAAAGTNDCSDAETTKNAVFALMFVTPTMFGDAI